jgi:hypothetical protein
MVNNRLLLRAVGGDRRRSAAVGTVGGDRGHHRTDFRTLTG